MSASTQGERPETIEANRNMQREVSIGDAVRASVNDVSLEKNEDAQPEATTPPSASKSPSTRHWMTFFSRIFRLANRKIDITIGRFTFIISVIALIVAVLSYGYGAASYHVAKSAYKLQQLEFCKDHINDPVCRSNASCPDNQLVQQTTYGSAASRSVKALPAFGC